MFPLLLVGLRRNAPTATLPVIALLAIVSAGACVTVTAYRPAAAFYLPVTRAWELLTGSLVAISGAWRGPQSDRVREATVGLGLTMVLIACVVTPAGPTFPGVWAILPVAGASLVVWGQGEESPEGRIPMATRLLSTPAMIAIGQASYSLYLWHWPVFSFTDYAGYLWSDAVRFTVKVGGSVGLAVASHYGIEKPLRRMLGNRGNWRMAYGVYLVGSLILFAAGAAVRSHDNVSTELAGVRGGGARYHGGPGRPVVMLLGDSHAGMYGPLLRDLCGQNGWQLVVATASGTNPLPGLGETDGRLWALAEPIIVREKPMCVVLVANWSDWLASPHAADRFDAAITDIVKHAGRLVILTQAPFLPDEASRESIRKGARPPFFERPEDSSVRRRVNDDVKAAARRNVVVVDAGRHFVDGAGAIRFWDDLGRQLFHDRIHLSDTGARVVADELQPAIQGSERRLTVPD